MKVASIGETDRGGAGLSALKLHRELLAQGVDSTFYVNRKTVDDHRIIRIPNAREGKDNSFRIGQYFPAEGDIPFTTGLTCKDEDFLEHVWDTHDIVLLRWSSVSVSDLTVSRWSHRSKPLVWCLSDMAPLTGGCHYSMGCDRYQTSCSPCPRIKPGKIQLPRLVINRRKRLWKNITFVSPSRWLAAIAAESSIARNKDIHIIRTGVELSLFRPYNKIEEKLQLGLDPGKPLLLFGAASVGDTRKGFRFLQQLVNLLNQHHDLRNKYNVLLVGAGSSRSEQLDCAIVETNHISSRRDMAKLYSAADITVLPYVEDNLPNVCLESIACGTPVVAFDIGGIPDVIIPGKNGQLARAFDVWDLANKVVTCLREKTPTVDIRRWAKANIDIKDQAASYIDLFKESLDRSAKHG